MRFAERQREINSVGEVHTKNRPWLNGNNGITDLRTTSRVFECQKKSKAVAGRASNLCAPRLQQSVPVNQGENSTTPTEFLIYGV